MQTRRAFAAVQHFCNTYFVYRDHRSTGALHTTGIMGKATAKKDKKYGQPVQDLQPLDEQIIQGRVSKTKNKYKLKLRAEEDGVSINCL